MSDDEFIFTTLNNKGKSSKKIKETIDITVISDNFNFTKIENSNENIKKQKVNKSTKPTKKQSKKD